MLGDIAPAAGPAKKPQLLWLKNDVANHYAETRERYKIQGELKIPRINVSRDWPFIFKGKAASTRRLVVYCTKLTRQFNDGSEHDLARKGCCETLQRVYDLCESEPCILSNAAREELKDLSLFVNVIYGRSLSQVASKQQGIPPFLSAQWTKELQLFYSFYAPLQLILNAVSCSFNHRTSLHIR